MAQLPNNTKYAIAPIIKKLMEDNAINVNKMLEEAGIDLFDMEVHQVDRLNLQLRMKPNGGGMARYITIKIAEAI